MTSLWVRSALTCAAWLPATLALATQEPAKVQMKPAEPVAGSPSTVIAPLTVEGMEPTELKRQTYNFVQTFATPTPKLEQIARWESLVCVSVQGLPGDQGVQIKTR